ncbi:hypothetical protein Brms1b_011213 [Colletotrichum noveboracense]|nr:hypothetical protein Brms1b_011213 [Colletotrichum noveboracense]
MCGSGVTPVFVDGLAAEPGFERETRRVLISEPNVSDEESADSGAMAVGVSIRGSTSFRTGEDVDAGKTSTARILSNVGENVG